MNNAKYTICPECYNIREVEFKAIVKGCVFKAYYHCCGWNRVSNYLLTYKEAQEESDRCQKEYFMRNGIITRKQWIATESSVAIKEIENNTDKMLDLSRRLACGNSSLLEVGRIQYELYLLKQLVEVAQILIQKDIFTLQGERL